MVRYQGRGGGGAGGRASGGGGGQVKDARLTLISKHRGEIKDARDMLVKMAKGQDARQKLVKIRNLKAGKLEEKKTRTGAVTITKTTQGSVILTTKRKSLQEQAKKRKTASAVASPGGQMRSSRRTSSGLSSAAASASAASSGINRRVGRGGSLRLSTASSKPGSVLRPKESAKRNSSGGRAASTGRASKRTSSGGGGSNSRLTRTIKGQMSEAAKLDDELMNTHVDPVILKRTVKNSSNSSSMRHASPPGRRYVPTSTLIDYGGASRRHRSRSPMDMDYDMKDSRESQYHSRMSASSHRRYNDYDDPRGGANEDELYRRRLMKDDKYYDRPRTMADRVDAGVSPLSGSKIVVSNLQGTVSQEDIMELFGDIGPLKRAKIIEPGTAEVVFVNKSDALKAVEIYHNRQLDGKAMKCQMVSSGSGRH